MERIQSDSRQIKYSIYLGSKCNLDCKYCHREATEEHGVTDTLLEKIKDADRITFIGGEPTMYMDEIKKVVDNTHAKYAITTNGVNFDRYRDYFKKHDFFVCISYDGNESLRGYDPFTHVIDYPKLGVSCTLYHGNTDFHKIMRVFSEKERIIKRPLTFYPHIMHVTSERNRRYALTFDDMDSIINQYLQILFRSIDEYNVMGIVNMRYRGILSQMHDALHAGYRYGETYCSNRYSHKVDTQGNEYSCLYIRDESPKDIKFSKQCKDCSVYSMCGGACVKSIDHDLECFFYGVLYETVKEHEDFLNEIGKELFA